MEVCSPASTLPQVDCFIDTGAAVSVISWPLRRELSWRPISAADPELRAWNEHPCDLGETVLRLFDRTRRLISAPLPVVAKFLRTPVTFHNDRFIILGLNFLMDNGGRLEVAGQPWNLAGYVEVPA